MNHKLVPIVFVILSLLPLVVAADPPPTTRPAAPPPATRPAAPAPPAPPPAISKEPMPLWLKLLKSTHLSTKWYLSYGYGEKKGDRYNDFRIGRGYVTVKLKPLKWFESRVTLDTHQDDHGDFKVRLKYLHGKFKLPMETAVLTNPYLEVGLVHTPWFDYEEHINTYRMEGNMFIERNGILNSADLGVTAGGLIGPKLSREYQQKVSKKYPGKWGSFALGVYNGGGYHAEEKNSGKVFQSRISLRPLSFVLPNLQVSHLFIHGQGNTETDPAYWLHHVMVSFEHQYFVVTGQYSTGVGNQKGSMVDQQGQALDNHGFSFFGEVKLPWIRSCVVGRYDYFDWDTDGGPAATSRIIAGWAFFIYNKNFAFLSVDHVTYHDDKSLDDWQVKLTLQLKYP